MIIRPETLRHYRKGFPLSQQRLADASGVSKKTIARIESGKTNPNLSTIKKLADALDIYPDDLAKPPNKRFDLGKEIMKRGFKPLSTYIDGETLLAFDMVAEKYGLNIHTQIVMAPLFAALLGESCLESRRRKIVEILETTGKLREFDKGRSSISKAASCIEGAVRVEEVSVERCDLLWAEVEAPDSDSEYHNPFADYLREFAEAFDDGDIALKRIELGIWNKAMGLPSYEIGSAVIEEITGGDALAHAALQLGYASLANIPKESRGDEDKEERVNWLIDQIPTEKLEEIKENLAYEESWMRDEIERYKSTHPERTAS